MQKYEKEKGKWNEAKIQYNYIETLLLNAVFREPNEDTLMAMREV